MSAFKRKILLTAFMTISAHAGLSTASSAQSADTDKGRKLFLRCQACHTLTASERPRMGPTLANLFSREVASLENFNYSKALKDADFTWDEQKLDEWLTNPNSFLPGNRMAFQGLRNPKDRKDLIAYLRSATTRATQK